MSKRAANILWTVVLVGLAVLLAFHLVGCHAPAPARVVLPSAAPVKVAIATAKASNAKAVQLAQQAETKGLVAGSPEARALTLALTGVNSQLDAALAQVDQLSAQLLTAQKHSDTQAQENADLRAENKTLRETVSWYRWRFWPAVILAGLFIVVGSLSRFTSWGAQTFGPYILGVERIAAKAAVLV